MKVNKYIFIRREKRSRKPRHRTQDQIYFSQELKAIHKWFRSTYSKEIYGQNDSSSPTWISIVWERNDEQTNEMKSLQPIHSARIGRNSDFGSLSIASFRLFASINVMSPHETTSQNPVQLHKSSFQIKHFPFSSESISKSRINNGICFLVLLKLCHIFPANTWENQTNRSTLYIPSTRLSLIFFAKLFERR